MNLMPTNSVNEGADYLYGFEGGHPVLVPVGKSTAGQETGAVVATTMSLSPTATAATVNTQRFQAALNRRGYVAFVTPGTYYVNATLILYSNTTLFLGPGVTIKKADGSSGGVFRNYAGGLLPSDPKVTQVTHGVAGAGITWGAGPDGDLNYVATISGVPGIGAKYPVGSFVSVVVTGHLTGISAQNVGYRGVYRVVQATTDGIKYEIRHVYPGANNPTAQFTIYPADTNIVLTGGGTIDGNGVNISAATYATGDPMGNVIWTRHAMGVRIDGISFLRGVSWTVGSNYVRDYVITNCRGDMRVGTTGFSNDFIHMSGNHQNVLIQNCLTFCEDNGVGMTIDIGDDPGNVTYYPQFNFALQDPGDMWEITLRDLTIHNISVLGQSFALVAIWGPPGYSYHNILVENLAGSGGAGVSSVPYPNTGMTQPTGDSLRIRDIHANLLGPAFITQGATSWDSVHVENVYCADGAQGGGAVSFVAGTGTATIRNLTVRSCQFATAQAGSPFTLVSLDSGAITTLNIAEIEGMLLASGVSMVAHSGSCTIGKAAMTNCSAISDGGASALWSSVGSTGVVGSVAFNNCAFTGTAGTGSLFSQGAAAAYTTVTMNGCTVTAAATAFLGANTTPTINVAITNLTVSSPAAGSYAGVFAGPTNLFVNGYNETSAMTNGPFRCLTTAKAYNFKFENVGRDTDLITKTAGNLRLHGMGARSALASVDIGSMTTGDSFYDLTNSIRKVRNIASSYSNLNS